jgi:hypothetical protein
VARFRLGSLFSSGLVCTACWLAACAASLGPGYVVEKQSIQVTFLPNPEPRIQVAAEYRLKNTGNQNLDSLDVRLPGRRFRPSAVSIAWDGVPLSQSSSPDNPRDTLVSFSSPWSIGATHTIRFTYDIRSASGEEGSIVFTPDAFNLPAEGWAPALPQPRGVFGVGGVPPKKWELSVRVPPGFLVHASGRNEKHSAKNSEVEFRFEQTADDFSSFVVAGRYHEAVQDLPGNQEVHVWSREEIHSDELQQAGGSLSIMLATYDSLFGARGKSKPPLWIVECPSEVGCVSPRSGLYSSILYGEDARGAAEMISRDTVLVDPRVAQGQREAIAGPALAASWLGYGQNPGFYEHQPPMSALPAFAAALARESSSGAQVRGQIIQRALAQVPAHVSRESNDDPAISRAKGILLFYALRDRVGPENFQRALQQMLSSRRGRGFDITDLISALEVESKQVIGPFVREWIKRPGVPADFRTMYSQSNARQDSLVQEAIP